MPNGAVVIVRKERKVVRRFREAGATSIDRAKALKDLGVERGAGLRRLRERGVIREGAPETYYLDEQAWTSLQNFRRRTALIVLGIVVVLVIIGVLIARLAAG